MTSTRAEQAEDLRFRVLKFLQEEQHISQRELAQKLGVSNGKLHYCMRALIDKGLVTLRNFTNSKHNLGYAYLVTPAGTEERASLTGRFLKRKIAECEALQREIASLQREIAIDSAPRPLIGAPSNADNALTR